MGACTFSNYIPGEDAELAFKTLRVSAEDSYGSGGYTGTIAEKTSFTMSDNEYHTMSEAHELIDRILEDESEKVSDKYGPAGCIKVFGRKDEKGFMFFGWASQ